LMITITNGLNCVLFWTRPNLSYLSLHSKINIPNPAEDFLTLSLLRAPHLIF
jgi:hypothetical protein